MRLLARYLLRECLAALGFCFSGFLILWVLLDLFSQLRSLQEHKLHGLDVVEYYFLRFPEFLPVALPMAFLLALLYALTNHARHNEITAIRAAGVSLWRLSLPYLGIGFVAAAVLFVSNEFCAPTMTEMAEQTLTKRVEKHLSAEERQQEKNVTFFNSRDGRFWRIGVYNLQNGEMTNPKVDWKLPDGSWRSLFADRAVRTNGVWTFFNVREILQLTGTNLFQIPLSQTGFVQVPELSETLDEIKAEIRITPLFRPTRTHKADIPVDQILNYLQLHPNPDKYIGPWIFTKLHGRFAGPFTCLVVVLLAVPFAAASGRRNVFVGVATSIFIFFVYYILQQISLALGEAGHLSPWVAAWLPNIVFGITGLFLMTKVR